MGWAHRKDNVPDANLAMPELPLPNVVGAQVGPPSFESVYRAHGKTVARWAIRLLGPRGDFEDELADGDEPHDRHEARLPDAHRAVHRLQGGRG